MIRRRSPRRGFTLVEILVAIALGIALLGIAVGISQSSAFASYKVVGSADRLSQWMLTAKSRAIRSKTPSGVRFLIDPNTGLCREIAYIEQPDPWLPPPPPATQRSIDAESPRLIVQRIVTQSPPQVPPAAGGNVDSTRVFLINVPDPTGIIQPGDLLFLPEVGQTYQISGNPVINPSVSPTDQNPAPSVGSSQYPPLPAAPTVTWTIGNPVVELTLTQPGDLGSRFGAGFAEAKSPPYTVAATYHTRNFGIIRQPRVLQGEPTQQLPSGMVVDFDATPKLHPVNRLPAVAPATVGLYPAQYDVLFAPSGEVVGAADGILAFTMRDAALAPTLALNNQASVNAAGQIILVCVYPRTGAIGTQPNNPPPPSPPATFDAFQFAKDGLNTGL